MTVPTVSTGGVVAWYPKPASMEGMPTELILKMMEQMYPAELAKFARSSSRFLEIFMKYRVKLMVQAVKNLPELENLLYLISTNKDELFPSQCLRPRRIDFCLTVNGKPQVFNFMESNVVEPVIPGKPWISELIYPVPKLTMGMFNLMDLWKMAKVVSWWVEIYPQLRWRESAEDRRCLTEQEEVRVRKAVGRWWLYAHYHHGFKFEHRNNQEPRRWTHDTRMMQIRRMSTIEIRELQDFWEIVRDTVSKDLCSSPERVCVCGQGYIVDMVPWGSDEYKRHDRIVSTYMKLDPDRIRHYLTNHGCWKADRMVEVISKHTRDFRRDTETLSIALRKVIEERGLARDVDYIPYYGIVDNRDIKEVEDGWTGDESHRGKVPLHWDVHTKFPPDPAALVRRGDDGLERSVPY